MKGVVAARANLHLGLHRRHVPHRAVSERQVLHRVGARALLGEVSRDPQHVRRAVQADQQVFARAAQRHAGRRQPRAQLDRVGIHPLRIVVPVGDFVLPRTHAEQVGIGAAATVQGVVPRAAVQDVGSGVAGERVIPAVADHHIISGPAGQVVIPCGSDLDVRYAACAAGKRCRKRTAKHVKLAGRLGGNDPVFQLLRRVPAQRCTIAIEIQYVGVGAHGIGAIQTVQRGDHGAVVQRDTVFVNVEGDLVQVGLQTGFEHQSTVDGFLELCVAFFKETILIRFADREEDVFVAGASGTSAASGTAGRDSSGTVRATRSGLDAAVPHVDKGQPVEALQDADEVFDALLLFLERIEDFAWI